LQHMPETRRFQWLPIFGFATAGLALGHVLSYAIAIPDPQHRDLALLRTGHGYLPAFGELATLLALAAVAAVVVRAFVRGRADPPSPRSSIGLLATVQVVAFAGQEILERLVAGAPLSDLLDERLLLIGVATQVIVAMVGGALLGRLSRAATLVAAPVAVRSALPPPRPVLAVPDVPSRPPGAAELGHRGVRAPPSA
jgi:hypothetical protein